MIIRQTYKQQQQQHHHHNTNLQRNGIHISTITEQPDSLIDYALAKARPPVGRCSDQHVKHPCVLETDYRVTNY